MRAIEISIAAFLIFTTSTFAQQHTAPGAGATGGSGYDPFQLNWSTGRFEYVPTPYDPSLSTGPYQYNSYSGTWDYVPVVAPKSIQEIVADQKASLNVAQVPAVNLNANARAGSLAPGAAPSESALPAGATIAPDVFSNGRNTTYNRTIPRVTNTNTRPTTKPATAPASTDLPKDPLGLSPKVGRWIYDTNAGRWVHVLP